MNVQTINISLPTSLVASIDELAKKELTSRSDIIREQLIKKVKAEQLRTKKELLNAQAYILAASKELSGRGIDDIATDDFIAAMRKQK